MRFSTLFFLILVFLYIFGLQFYKKRPVVLTKRLIIILIVTILLFFISISVHLILFWIITATLLVIPALLLDFWLIFGIQKINLIEALNKATIGTQTSTEPVPNGINLISPSGKITLKGYIFNSSIVVFKINKDSAKHLLLKKVFKKFIDNYHIKF